MTGIRAPRATPVGAAPRALRIRHTAVWGSGPDDDLAPRRWQHAAHVWRATAHDAGVPNADVWRACPAGRFLLGEGQARLREFLERIGATEDDVDAIAAEARELWPRLFDPSWTSAGRTTADGWHLRGVAARRGTFGQPL